MGSILFINVKLVDAGCAGDCISCHPKLENDETHLSLKSCIKCHNPTEKKVSILNISGQGDGCGDNCFQCHKEWPKNGYHAPLDNCQNCHKK
ncbi:MAG: hypothetical protein LDL13_09245 [Calditerrivibrio sp.]|nr:hypothetical protein [Calditerrivibrio sp.]